MSADQNERATAIEDAVNGRNDLVWLAMQYRCVRCGAIEWICCGVGIEGPPELRQRGLYIASPFMGPACIATASITALRPCGGETIHVDWNQDKTFMPRPPPIGARYFRIPPTGINRQYYETSAFAGEMAIALPTLT